MDVDRLLSDYLIHGVVKNHKKHVGMELEFPIVNLTGGPVPMDALRAMFAALEEAGCRVERRSPEGMPLSAEDGEGNTITFDTCYENLEYVTNNLPSMPPLYRQFRHWLRRAQGALESEGCALLGVAYNPLLENHWPRILPDARTRALNAWLCSEGRGVRGDFFCCISSEQVHFNLDAQELPTLFETFARLDWLNILLFSNSPGHVDGREYMCMRNELYLRSVFGGLGLTGCQDIRARTLEDVARSYRGMKQFLRQRDGKLESFPATPVEEYYADARCGVLPEDLLELEVERNILTTPYGTAEYRVLCAQPFDESFCPSAFNEGLRVMLPETLRLARAFDEKYALPQPNVRCEMASRGDIAFVARDAIESYADDLLALSRKGLARRGYGEEAFLGPLEKRPALLENPARRLAAQIREKGLRPAVLARRELGEDLL